jgi:hypothetical protein
MREPANASPLSHSVGLPVVVQMRADTAAASKDLLMAGSTSTWYLLRSEDNDSQPRCWCRWCWCRRYSWW